MRRRLTGKAAVAPVFMARRRAGAPLPTLGDGLRRTVLAAVAVLLGLVVPTTPAAAEAEAGSNTHQSADFFRDAVPPPGASSSATIRERYVTVDLDLLRTTLGTAGDSGGQVAFRLFDDVVIETPGRFEARPTGFSWSGSGVKGGGQTQQVVLSAQDAHLTSPVDTDAAVGQFWSGSQTFLLRHVGGALHVIRELDPAALHGRDEGIHGPAEAGAAGPSPSISAQSAEPTSASTDSVTTSSSTSEVDILVAYTPSAAAAQGTALATWIDSQVTSANQANTTSGLPFRFRKVAQIQVNYTETANDIRRDLDLLRGTAQEDTVLNEVHSVRDENGADLVVLLGRAWNTAPDVDKRACGSGYVMNSISSSFATLAFSVVDVHDGCELTFAHEIGHNMALRHDWPNDDTNGAGSPFRYNHGHVVPGSFRTILAYTTGPTCACGRIPNWSDPDVTVNTFATGVPDNGTNQPADNARALGQTYTTVAQFRPHNSIGGSGGKSSPSVVSWGSNRLDVFQRGPNNTLQHKFWNGSVWSGWGDLGGGLNGGPDAASWASNRLDVFVRGTDNRLHHKWWDGIRWSVWEDLGGTLTSDPSAVSWGPGRLDVFVRGTDNAMWRRYYNGVAWSAWHSLGGTLTSNPDAASWGLNRLDVFVRGHDNAMWQKWWDGVAWQGYISHGGTLAGGPGAVSWGSNRIDVFVRGTDNGLWRRLWNGSGWSGYGSLAPGGSLSSDPDAASWAAGRLDAVYRNPDGTIHRWWN